MSRRKLPTGRTSEGSSKRSSRSDMRWSIVDGGVVCLDSIGNSPTIVFPCTYRTTIRDQEDKAPGYIDFNDDSSIPDLETLEGYDFNDHQAKTNVKAIVGSRSQLVGASSTWQSFQWADKFAYERVRQLRKQISKVEKGSEEYARVLTTRSLLDPEKWRSEIQQFSDSLAASNKQIAVDRKEETRLKHMERSREYRKAKKELAKQSSSSVPSGEGSSTITEAEGTASTQTASH